MFDCLHLIFHGFNSSVKVSLLASGLTKFYHGKNLETKP